MREPRCLRMRTLPIVVLVGLILTITPSRRGEAQQIAPPKLPFEKYVLANGLNVILHEDHSAPIVAVNLWYHVGSKNEKRGRTGFAHLFEHMMFQGSKHHDTDFFKAIEPLGATDLNGTTNEDRTNYFQSVPSNALERVLWLEADRMGWLLPAMTQERLDNQREVVKNERRQGVDNQPYGLVSERMAAVLYPPHHPYSWSVIGSMEDLAAASKQDVENFFKDYYGPNNCTLVIAGDIDVTKTKALVEKHFGPITPGPPVHRAREWIPELTKEVRLSMEDRVSLPRLYITWHAPPAFTQGEANLDVTAGLLTRGKTSRLYKRLVYDLKVAQDVTAFHDGREIGGLFSVVVTAAPGHTLDELEPLVLEEVEKLKSAPVPQEDVERIKTSLLAGFIRNLERVGGFGGKSDRLGHYNTFLGNPGYIEKDFARYQAVTPQSVQATARRWLHEGRAVMRVIPFPDLKAGKEAAGVDRAAIPAVGEPKPLVLPSLQRAKLSNGLQVVLAENRKIPVVQLDLIVGGGWSADRKDKLGAASFSSAMQDEGTKTRSALQISDETEQLGATIACFSGLDTATVRLNALKARLEPSLALWADIVMNPAFPPEEIERRRQQVLGQILQEKTDPVGMGIRILPALVYGSDHPYGQPLTGTGTEESVKAITREDLVSFHGAWFKPNNATLVIVGDTTLSEIVPRLEKVLGGWRPGETPKISIPQKPQPARTIVYLIDKPGAVQSVLLAGNLLPAKNDPDDVAFNVLNTILGGQFISRINMNLREEKGYSYGAGSFPFDARGQSMFLAFSLVRSDVTKESIAEMLKELRDIRGSRPVTAEELRQAQSNLALSLPGQYETIGGIAGKITEVVTYGLPEDYPSTYPDKVRKTTSEGLTELAKKRVLPDNLVLVVVGDRATVEPKLKELNIGPISYLDADGRPLR